MSPFCGSSQLQYLCEDLCHSSAPQWTRILHNPNAEGVRPSYCYTRELAAPCCSACVYRASIACNKPHSSCNSVPCGPCAHGSSVASACGAFTAHRGLATQVLSNALIPLLAALALVPVTGGADVPLAAESSGRVVRLLGVFLGTPRRPAGSCLAPAQWLLQEPLSQ